MKWPTMDKFAQMVADKALDEVEYNGKTLRQWIEIISASEHGTNLAEVGADAISRQQAIKTVGWYSCHSGDKLLFADNALRQLPPIQPVEPQIIRCKDCENWDTTWTNDFSPNYHYCPMVDGVRKEDWFCADAERRTDE